MLKGEYFGTYGINIGYGNSSNATLELYGEADSIIPLMEPIQFGYDPRVEPDEPEIHKIAPIVKLHELKHEQGFIVAAFNGRLNYEAAESLASHLFCET